MVIGQNCGREKWLVQFQKFEHDWLLSCSVIVFIVAHRLVSWLDNLLLKNTSFARKMKSIGILLTLGISIVMLSGGVMGFQYDDNSDTNDRYRDNERDRYDGRNRSEDYRDGDNSPSYRPYYHHHHHHHHHHKCQSERFEHQVIMKNYKDSTGHWVLYSQIIETRNIGNRCNHNEYIYLAHRQKSGWLWNPKINSLVHFSLGEPKFISRRVWIGVSNCITWSLPNLYSWRGGESKEEWKQNNLHLHQSKW